MDNPAKAARRIIGVRTTPVGSLQFCVADEFSPQIGDWVLVEGERGNFPARVALPGSLIETAQLVDNLPQVTGLAQEADLLEARILAAVEAEVSRKFVELSAAYDWPYTLKEVIAFPDRLSVKFSAGSEPDNSDYVTLLKTFAVVSKTRLELFLVSENSNLPDKLLAGPDFVERVNGLLKPLDTTILAGAVVGEPLLDESQVYRPGGHTGGERPNGRQNVRPISEAEKPTAVLDLDGKIRVNGVELAL